MLIDVILLRLASVLSSDVDDMTIVPGWNALNTGRPSLEGVIDYLVARRPSKYSGMCTIRLVTFRPQVFLLPPDVTNSPAGLILSEPVGALSRPDLVHAGSNSIFEARTFSELSSGLTQAVLAVASSCRETEYVLPRSIVVPSGC